MNIERALDYKTSRRGFLKGTVMFGATAAINPTQLGRFFEETDKTVTPSILMYHEVTYDLVRNDFMSRLRRGEQPISHATFIGILNRTIKLPSGLATFLPTADDGRLSQYDGFRKAVDYVREQMGIFIPVTFFALTMFNKLIEEGGISMEEVPDDTPCFNDNGANQYMSKGKLVALIQDGHTIGNHTKNHWDLTTKDETGRNFDIDDADTRIQSLYDEAGVERNSRVIAYPFGRFTQTILERVKDQGFDAGFGTDLTTSVESLRRYAILRQRRS